MKIPKSINIFSINYKIVIEKDYFIGEDDDKLLQGECDLNDKIIRIRKTDEDNMFNTLLHESIHAVCFELGLYDDEHNEQFIDRLSLGLVDVLVRNKFLKE